jgi:hypothetical protein
MDHKHHSCALAALDAQIESANAGLREISARLETIKATAAAIHSNATRETEALRETLELRNELGNLDQIIPIKEAARLRGVSVDTLCRNHRDKFVQLSERRLGMRRKDALMLRAK